MYPKPKTHRDKKYIVWLRTQSCCACGNPPIEGYRDIVACHSGGGMGTKGPDNEAVSLCVNCHGIEHRAPESFWQSVTLITGKNRDAYVKELWTKYNERT